MNCTDIQQRINDLKGKLSHFNNFFIRDEIVKIEEEIAKLEQIQRRQELTITIGKGEVYGSWSLWQNVCDMGNGVRRLNVDTEPFVPRFGQIVKTWQSQNGRPVWEVPPLFTQAPTDDIQPLIRTADGSYLNDDDYCEYFLPSSL